MHISRQKSQELNIYLTDDQKDTLRQEFHINEMNEEENNDKRKKLKNGQEEVKSNFKLAQS